ncbi:hypothetical protein ACJ73_02595 [Blastomyces percursus]|uniref:Uncharacterized protein n=1 Tax=Blastomyces percursus TaxID=1658174 RepID=A0A1J9R0R6_9EURO|nr:hypothetical protein ACJ73_02595 [Blastomyces percursus]
MSVKTNYQRARESFATIYSYYLHNRDSVKFPNWANSPESGTIIIGFVTDATPTEEEMGKAKDDLRILMMLEEAKENLSESEKSLLGAATDRQGSIVDRYSGLSYSATVEEGIAIDAKTLA